MTRPLVLVTRALPEGWLTSLEAECEVLVGAPEPGLDDTLLAALPRADAILALLTETIDDALLDRAPNLRVVSNMAVGVDNIDVDACTRRGIPVGHTPGVLTDSTAELTMALMLAAARGIPAAAADAREGRWATWSPTGWLGRDLRGATLGVIGLGQIGQAVARRAGAFGMKVVVCNRSDKPKVVAELGARQVALPQLLAASDFVSLHVPLSTDTTKLIDAQALAQMKSTAVLINTARGPIVDTDALVDALANGTLAAAALDVTCPEPLPAEHAMYTLPNLLITPHIGSATTRTRRAMAERACQNVLAGLAGLPLPACVNQG